MNAKISYLLVISVLVTSGCAHTTAQGVRNKLDEPKPEVALFSHCSAYGCSTIQKVSFEDSEWQTISQLFTTPPANAVQERELLPKAIALMERIVGPKTGTSQDIARSWTLTFMPKGQLDCIDESINTTTYLEILDRAGLIRHHDIGQIAIRGNKVDLMLLHNTATLIEHESGISYAIDSWFGANGLPPNVVLLDDWIKGWKPSE